MSTLIQLAGRPDITEVLALILEELDCAENAHPKWPDDLVHAAAVVTEEAGELLKEANNVQFGHKGSTMDEVKNEAIQTGAMAIRFLLNMHKVPAHQELVNG